MILECRAETYEDNRDLEQRVRARLEHSPAMHGLTCQIESIGEATTAVCDTELKAAVLQAAESVSFNTDYRDEHPLGACEDAAFLMLRVQKRVRKATYSILGTTTAAPHHNPKSAIDERILPAAIDLLEQIAIQTLN
jgi:aminobenzoyl-glutamate utilization protein A